ncbi:MAG: proline iminopeptidase-family hydrolase [Actinomycetes bacterium]
MSTDPSVRPAQVDGEFDVRGYRTRYRVTGDLNGDRAAVILLHGGPGYPSYSLEPLEELAATGRAVIRYDQLGCGESSLKGIAHDSAMFTIDLYLEELALLIEHLGLDRYVLIGQSWGGMLALEFALTSPSGLAGLVLYSTLASVEEWTVATNALIATLSDEVQRVLAQHGAAGTTDSPEFRAAEAEFNRRFVCRLDPLPECAQRSEASLMADGEVYRVMAGGSEFDTGGGVGVLAGWDVRPRLHEIMVPTLCLSGEFDEATPAVMGTLAAGIDGAQWHIIEGAAHSSHLEAPDLFFPLVVDFLARLLD